MMHRIGHHNWATFELGNSKNPFSIPHLIQFHALFSVQILILDLHYYPAYYTVHIFCYKNSLDPSPRVGGS